MVEVKLLKTAYRYRNNAYVYINAIPLCLLALLCALFRRDSLVRVKTSFFHLLLVNEVIKEENLGISVRNLSPTVVTQFSDSLTSNERLYILSTVLVLVVLVALVLSIWILPLRLWIFYSKCGYREGTLGFHSFVLDRATHIFVHQVNDKNKGVNEPKRTVEDALLAIERSRLSIYYMHDHKKFLLDKASHRFKPVEHIDRIDVSNLSDWTGLSSKEPLSPSKSGLESDLLVCSDLYGPNDYEIPKCNFWKMLMDAFLAPFFQFQLITTLLWILDDYLYYSLISIASMVIIEVQMVYKRILEYDRINAMRLPPSKLYVYRDSKWVTVLSTDVFPGDIILIYAESGSTPTLAPADSLILSGEVVVDESILTGESIPQFKSAVDRSNKTLDLRNSTIFAGTSIVLSRPGSDWNGIKSGKTGCICLVLRTGFESYQGRLVHAITHSGERVTASTTEGWCFLGILLMFALSACIVVFKRAQSSSMRKLLLVSSRILVSVIPPEFPVTLSMAVTIAIVQLRRKGLYCTEPFRLPFAGILDVCAFDKTGTLSEDSMSVVGIFSDPTTLNDKDTLTKLPISSAMVIGGCHSLNIVGTSVVGDPMEKASFEFFGFNLLSDGCSVESLPSLFYDKSGESSLHIKIIRRWQFTSELGRMSVIANVSGKSTFWSRSGDVSPSTADLQFQESFDGESLLLCKGSPDHIRRLLRDIPPYYDHVCQELTIKGLRVLTLAYKRLYDIPNDTLLAIDRAIIEKDLEFSGFLALEAPIKSSCLPCMRRLNGHKLIMITGDNVLTACHVASVAEIADRSESFVKTRKYAPATKPKSPGFTTPDRCPVKSESFEKCPLQSKGAESPLRCPISKFAQEGTYKPAIERCPLYRKKPGTSPKAYEPGLCPFPVKSKCLESKCPISKGDSKDPESYREFFEKCPISKPTALGLGVCPIYKHYENSDSKCPLSHPSDKIPKDSKCPFSIKSKNVDTLPLSEIKCPLTKTKQALKRFFRALATVLKPLDIENLIKYGKNGEAPDFGDFVILTCVNGSFVWKKRNGENVFSLSNNSDILFEMSYLLKVYRLCLTGPTLDSLLKVSSQGTVADDAESALKISQQDVSKIVLNCTVFARMSPQQKEFIIQTFKNAGKIIAMCGDGTNDIAALKVAHVGLSLLNNPLKKNKRLEPPKTVLKTSTTKPQSVTQRKLNFPTTIKKSTSSPARGLGAPDYRRTVLNERYRNLTSELDDDMPQLKLGEASIASPFTYHKGDVFCVPTLVKSGRCALSNVVMLYKLMGINSLMSAMGMSVLALDGVNFSDAQTTLYSLLYTYLVIALSKSKPSDETTTKKPAKSIFSPPHFISLCFQLLIHGFILLYTWNLGKGFRSPDYVGDLDAKFEPNIVNTLIFYICFAVNLSSFISNYIDYPYMEPLENNAFVYKPILGSFLVLAMFITDIFPPISDFFSLVPIPNHLLRAKVIALITFDVAASYIISKFFNNLS